MSFVDMMHKRSVDFNKMEVGVGQRVEWRDEKGNLCDGTIYAMHSYGFGGYLVIEEYVIVDHRLVMMHSSQVRVV